MRPGLSDTASGTTASSPRSASAYSSPRLTTILSLSVTGAGVSGVAAFRRSFSSSPRAPVKVAEGEEGWPPGEVFSAHLLPTGTAGTSRSS